MLAGIIQRGDAEEAVWEYVEMNFSIRQSQEPPTCTSQEQREKKHIQATPLLAPHILKGQKRNPFGKFKKVELPKGIEIVNGVMRIVAGD
jgi:hypothetical protein